jgi:hypothetical protein
MYFDLWDLQSGNQVETFGTKEEALAAVLEYLAVNTPDYGEVLSLGYDDEHGESGIIAEGKELVALALRHAAQREPLVG